jgi:malic enzyme
VYAIAGSAEEEQNEVVAAAHGSYDLSFGPQYLIPKPFDPRLIVRIAPAVARRRWTAAWPPGRLPTSTPIPNSCNSLSTTPAAS